MALMSHPLQRVMVPMDEEAEAFMVSHLPASVPKKYRQLTALRPMRSRGPGSFLARLCSFFKLLHLLMRIH